MHATSAVTGFAGLHFRTWLRTIALTDVTLPDLRDKYFTHAAEDRFFEGNFNVYGDIAAATGTRTATAEDVRKASTEEIGKIKFNAALTEAIEVKAAKRIAPCVWSRSAASKGLAVVIIFATLFLIGENAVCLGDFLERSFITTLLIRVVLLRQLAERFLDIVLRGLLIDAQCFVVVLCHTVKYNYTPIDFYLQKDGENMKKF